MTTNADNAMARFLFAILKQKNLKDIDWNQVANDPVLLQPITNGHAARMRYSRFRSTITGHEPQKRRSSAEKCRASKSSSKRSPYTKKELITKSESGTDLASFAQFTPDVSPYITDLGDDFDNPRFMTPCSDDQSLSIHPSAIHQISQPDFDFDASPDFFKQEPESGGEVDFSAFEAAYDISALSAGTFDSSSQGVTELGATQTLVPCASDWAKQFQDGNF